MPVASCPECESEIKFDNPVEVGERLFCPECAMELEVITEKPLTLDYFFDDDEEWEDWEDEDWEED
jgi:alpha-aminoadipate carrier protein LysW